MAGTRDPLPDRTDDVFLKELLDSTNALRARHGAAALTLDKDLVTNAKARAQVVSSYDGLNENHQGATPGLGENLSWQASGSDVPAPTSGASLGWYSEIIDYSFADAKGYDDRWVPGHFTQLVWNGSTKFGAARAFGKSPGSQFYETYIVANFSVAGNMAGDFAANVATPTMGQDSDATLRWVSFDGTKWSAVTLLSEHQSSTGPAAAVFSDTPYCVHRNNANTGIAYSNWAADTAIPDCQTDQAPALAVYRDALYCAYRGAGADSVLRQTNFNGMSWSAGAELTGCRTSAAPALAGYQDKLFCAFRGDGTDTAISYTAFDGTSWTGAAKAPNTATTTAPALAVYQDKLYCAHGIAQETRLAMTRFDGTAWTSPAAVLNCQTGAGPALAVYKDKLVCVYRGMDGKLRFLSFDGTSWTTQALIPVASSTGSPALMAYHDRLYCVYRK